MQKELLRLDGAMLSSSPSAMINLNDEDDSQHFSGVENAVRAGLIDPPCIERVVLTLALHQ